VLADRSLQQRQSAGGNEASVAKSADAFATWAAQEGAQMKTLMQQPGAAVD
jgi:hypothetical protein